MRAQDFVVSLRTALEEYRFGDVASLTAQLSPTDFDNKTVRTTLGLLRRKRRFCEMETAASRFFLAGYTAPVVRRQYAQALLDQNKIEPALCTLRPLLLDVAGDPGEASEAQGLIGRAFKQRYVNEGHADDLISAVAAYTPQWKARQGDYRWHGINLAALIERARRDGIVLESREDPQSIARQILDDIEESATGVWDYATAMEAAVVLGDPAGALKWASKYVAHPDADAFEVGSTLRQLKEVWRIQATDLGPKLLPALEYAVLQREGAVLEPAALGHADREGFEAVWGLQSFTFLQWIDTMYVRCTSVARLFDSASGTPQGTGFLVAGESLKPDWGAAPVLVTNAHVVSVNHADEAPLRPEDASAEFTRVPGRPRVALGQLLFSSPRTDLDVSVLRVEAPAGSHTLVSTDYLPVLPQPGKEPQRIYVIGHPAGAELAVSLYDNSLVGYQGPYVHYKSPTEGGHSGSPVFNKQWKLFALHHRSREELQVNEGVCLTSIREAI